MYQSLFQLFKESSLKDPLAQTLKTTYQNKFNNISTILPCRALQGTGITVNTAGYPAVTPSTPQYPTVPPCTAHNPSYPWVPSVIYPLVLGSTTHLPTEPSVPQSTPSTCITP